MNVRNVLSVLLIVVFLGLFSCSPQEHLKVDSSENESEFTTDKPSREELLFLYQKNTDNALIELVRYSESEKEFILDLSIEDAKSIGITDEEYNNILKIVEKLNKCQTK
ncbi:hypothetical protein [Porphyromonas levii]|uniref:hypothetical protein n=1 Tax=Porphyromonas levii TaxID=28114 RepID=UPI001B8B6E8B|nr:hypothetical protein [Porphyromonas levii]MBR8704068.1 hypothetical protein [Porphyromonas levii]MBR8713890.1 hypothetical protein [Porphyromonas levii]MBR8715890.1 hypothetical protein [Porphyromonas levii]MBR8728438.1 hypothetical protein [Porphyromonas levii]MBR8736762.1 hypothetical protein [Porphyromonas levii]